MAHKTFMLSLATENSSRHPGALIIFDESVGSFLFPNRNIATPVSEIMSLRYCVNTFCRSFVDDYPEITDILRDIESAFKRNNVLISGSADDYAGWGRSPFKIVLKSGLLLSYKT